MYRENLLRVTNGVNMGVSTIEISDRHDRLRRLMESQDLDAILVGEKYNYWYLTGHQSREFDKIMRPMLFLLPRAGAPCAIIYRQQIPKLEKTCPGVRAYGYEDVPFEVALLQQALDESGTSRGRLGMELGENQRLGLPYADLRQLLADCPGLTLADAGPELQELRMQKSTYEIDTLRTACDVSLQAWELTLKQMGPGSTELDLRRLLATELSRLGSDFDVAGHVSTSTSKGGDPSSPLERGDAIWSDFGATYEGYQADVARRAVFGPPTPEHRATRDQMASLVEASLEAVRPGNRASDVAQACSARLVDLGMPALTSKKRIGHGLGLNAGEPPSLSLADNSLLVPGMVLCVEPRFFLSTGEKIHVEDVVVVSESGFDYISQGATELQVIDN
jgi:Xaa-Pro dipeptidase